MNVILLEPREIAADGHAIVRDDRARHVREVLRAKIGDTLDVGLLDGPFGSATVLAIEDATLVLRCAFEGVVPPVPRVDLLLALPRPKVMRRLWAQLAALGVGRIMLTNAARVEKGYFTSRAVEEALYRPLLMEGLQQARDTRLPRVSIHRLFRPLVEDDLGALSDAAVRLVADPAGAPAFPAVAMPDAGERVLLAIGPEGGWVPFELELLAQHGFSACGLGPRTLRTDTACIALLALLHAALRAAS